MIEIPKNIPDVGACFRGDCLRLANEYAESGTVKHFALRLGFMPHNEADAEAILKRMIDEREWLETELENARRELSAYKVMDGERRSSY